MKKIKLLIIVLIFLSLEQKIISFLFCDYGGDYLNEWKVQAYYKEKYFEYNFYYDYYNFLTDYGTIKNNNEMLSGMKQNFGLRLGLPENYILNTDLLYVFQKIGEENYNNLQAITFLIEKNKKDFFDLIFGFKIPLWDKETKNIRILTEKEKLNIIFGIFYNLKYYFLKSSFFVLLEIPVYIDIDYMGDLSAGKILGFNIYDDKEKQSVDFLFELALNAVENKKTYSVIGVIIPQLKIKFYSDFEFKIGMQILGYAENCFYHKDDKSLYIVKLNYIINSDNRKKEKEVDVLRNE